MARLKAETMKYSALCKALQSGDQQGAEHLISKKAPVNPTEVSPSNTPLHWAVIQFDNIDIIKMLLDKGAKIQAKNEIGQTPLHLAIAHKKEDIVKYLMDNPCDNDDELISLITDDAANGNKDIAKFLADYSHTESTPLNIINAVSAAIENGHVDVLNHLLHYCTTHGLTNQYISYDIVMKNGPSSGEFFNLLRQNGFTIFTQEDEDNFQIIYKGVEYKCLQTVEDALKSGINININNKSTGLAPLHVACINSDAAMVKLLIEHKVNLNIKVINSLSKGCTGMFFFKEQSAIRRTPLFIAFQNSDIDTTKLLLLNGADIKEEPNMLFTAVKKLFKEMIELLLDHGADVNAVDQFQGTPLLYSIVKLIEPSQFFQYQALQQSKLNYDEKKESIVELLLKKGANPNVKVKEDIYSPLQAAIIEGYVNIVQLLLQYNADVKYSNADGNTPLHLAANSHSNILDLLLQHNPRINVANNECNTPLHLAAASNNYDTLDILLKKGVNVNDFNKNGNTALHLVCRKCENLRNVQLLLNYHANVNANMNGVTPLHILLWVNRTAKLTEYIEILELMLQHNADIDAVGCRGKTPLIYASKTLNNKIVKILLKYGADVTCTNLEGNAPLHMAVEKGDPQTFKHLLNYGADINTLNKKNKSAIDVMKECMEGIDFTDRSSQDYFTSFAIFYSKLFKFAKEHVIKLVCANLEINKHILDIIGDNETYDNMFGNYEHVFGFKPAYSSEYSTFEKRCKNEVDKLKRQKVGTITWYSFLTKSIHDLTKFVKNEQISNALLVRNLEKKFPLYAGIIKNKFIQAVKRAKLLENVQKYIVAYIFPGLPLICQHEIFRYLDVTDLRAFNTAIE